MSAPLLADGAPLSPELKKAIKAASTRKCERVAEANQENITFLLEDDLRVMTQGGTSIMAEVFGSTMPAAIQKIRTSGYVPAASRPPAGWEDFLTVVRDTMTEESRCLDGAVPAAVLAWSQGKPSVFGDIVTRTTRQVDAMELARKAKQSQAFKSFEEAQATLAPLMGDNASFIPSTPEEQASLQGKVIAVKMKIVKVVRRGEFRMTNFPASSSTAASPTYDGVMAATYAGPEDFARGEVVEIIGDVTTAGQKKSSKTALTITIYGIKASR